MIEYIVQLAAPSSVSKLQCTLSMTGQRHFINGAISSLAASEVLSCNVFCPNFRGLLLQNGLLAIATVAGDLQLFDAATSTLLTSHQIESSEPRAPKQALTLVGGRSAAPAWSAVDQQSLARVLHNSRLILHCQVSSFLACIVLKRCCCFTARKRTRTAWWLSTA